MEKKLRDRFGIDPGFKIPDGYFDSFYQDMAVRLPDRPQAPEVEKLTKWQRFKPYIYLAAMFAGIWCMMKVFHTASQNATLNLDNPPAHIAMLMENDPDLDLYATPEYWSDEDVDSLLDSYDDMADLEKDMGIKIDAAYEELDVEETQK